MGFERLPGITGGRGGCAHCGYQHEILPLDARIGVGFGYAALTRDGEAVYQEATNAEWDDLMTVAQAEDLAAVDPEKDWRIHFVAPLSERHYQRQGPGHWVLYEKGEGFA